ncbi:hypothetical protein MMPV_009496 [Pyropia vietnamensis]
MAFVAVTPAFSRKTSFLAAPATSATPTGSRVRPAPATRVVIGMATGGGPKRVLVSGATGRTGRLAMAKLATHPDALAPIGLVRSAERAAEVLDPTAQTVVGDVTDRDGLAALVGEHRIDAVVVLSSAIPKFKPAEPGARPEHYFEDGGEPESVDWEGGRNVVDVAKEAGLDHVVLVGSMGSTDSRHPLNAFGNILKWKRQAEQYLIDSGVAYTIINPGGLQDADGGRRELVVGHNDEIYKLYGTPAIPRSDVAELVVQALLHPEVSKNKAMDVITKPEGEGTVTQDWAKLFAQTQSQL